MQVGDLNALYGTLKSARDVCIDDALTIELYFKEARTESELFAQVRRRLTQAVIRLREVFAEDGKPDHYFFLTLPEANPSGLETYAFDLARRLGASLGADEANLLLPQGLTYADQPVPPHNKGLGKDLAREEGSELDKPELGKGWAPNAVEADLAWRLTRGDTARIAQVDTGHTNHVELEDVFDLTAQLNLVERSTPQDASDRFSTNVWFPNPGHGTYGASVMASRGGLAGSNAEPPGQITGVAPDAKIVPIRAIRSVVDLNLARIPEAIRHAIRTECDVVVMCLGGISHSASVQKAMKDAVDAGLIIVCAAGNIWPAVVFPAAYAADRLCVAVAAVDENFRPWEYTARGSAVTVSAPGENVWAARKKHPDDGGDALCNGTTLACSLTAGIAALFVARHGRDNLRRIASARGISVQELFNRAIVHDLMPPRVWNGATNLGAGVVNAWSTLAYEIDKTYAARSLAKRDVPQADFVSAPDMLRRLVGADNRLAALEIDTPVEPFAQELIWLRYMEQGRSVAFKLAPTDPGSEPQSSDLVPDAMPTPALTQLLAFRPNLAASIGL